jgi:hypothetical protein
MTRAAGGRGGIAGGDEATQSSRKEQRVLSGVFGSRNMRFTQIVLSGSFGAHIMTRGQCDRLSEIS